MTKDFHSIIVALITIPLLGIGLIIALFYAIFNWIFEGIANLITKD